MASNMAVAKGGICNNPKQPQESSCFEASRVAMVTKIAHNMNAMVQAVLPPSNSTKYAPKIISSWAAMSTMM